MTSREKAIDSIEKIINFEIVIDDWKMFLSSINKKSITIGDIIDGNLSDELLTIYNVIEQPTIDDAISVVKELKRKDTKATSGFVSFKESDDIERKEEIYDKILTALKGLKGEK